MQTLDESALTNASVIPENRRGAFLNGAPLLRVLTTISLHDPPPIQNNVSKIRWRRYYHVGPPADAAAAFPRTHWRPPEVGGAQLPDPLLAAFVALTAAGTPCVWRPAEYDRCEGGGAGGGKPTRLYAKTLSHRAPAQPAAPASSASSCAPTPSPASPHPATPEESGFPGTRMTLSPGANSGRVEEGDDPGGPRRWEPGRADGNGCEAQVANGVAGRIAEKRGVQIPKGGLPLIASGPARSGSETVCRELWVFEYGSIEAGSPRELDLLTGEPGGRAACVGKGKGALKFSELENGEFGAETAYASSPQGEAAATVEYGLFVQAIYTQLNRVFSQRGAIRMGDSFIFLPSFTDPELAWEVMKESFASASPGEPVLSCTINIYLTSANLILQPVVSHLAIRPLHASDFISGGEMGAGDADSAAGDGGSASPEKLEERRVILSPHGAGGKLILHPSKPSPSPEAILSEWSALFFYPPILPGASARDQRIPATVAVRLDSSQTIAYYPTPLVFCAVVASPATSTLSRVARDLHRWAWRENAAMAAAASPRPVDYWSYVSPRRKMIDAVLASCGSLEVVYAAEVEASAVPIEEKKDKRRKSSGASATTRKASSGKPVKEAAPPLMKGKKTELAPPPIESPAPSLKAVSPSMSPSSPSSRPDVDMEFFGSYGMNSSMTDFPDLDLDDIGETDFDNFFAPQPSISALPAHHHAALDIFSPAVPSPAAPTPGPYQAFSPAAPTPSALYDPTSPQF
ncbi:hypothetical protein BDK51DRAFT_48702, partial [Blyttiomyces helicus]